MMSVTYDRWNEGALSEISHNPNDGKKDIRDQNVDISWGTVVGNLM